MTAGHGPNIGHGYVKYMVLDGSGREVQPVVFPAMIARAARQVAGALKTLEHVTVGGGQWWIGQDALASPSPITLLAQERLTDPVFIPALLKGALQRFEHLNGASTGHCVTGLPATWARDAEKARALGARLREATPHYSSIMVIPEPLGLIYAKMLDNDGNTVHGTLEQARVGVVDLGHHTVDICVVRALYPEPASLETYTLGTARPLKEIRAKLSAAFERELTLYETDMAVRARRITIAGRGVALPTGWDRPLLQNAETIVARLREAWGSGAALDTILVGGGGAELAPLTDAITGAFPHAVAIEDGQIAIARGYARLARRKARGA